MAKDRGTTRRGAKPPRRATPPPRRRSPPALPGRSSHRAPGPASAQTVDVASPTLPARPLIVGVGASAGGLEAFTQLLEALPADPGFGIVLVQHLAPQHESALPSLLSAGTPLRVVQAEDGMRVRRNQVYVIPPNAQIGIEGEVLRLTPRPSDRAQYFPVDFFLRALADAAQDRAVAVILSGTASDGANGVRDIKAAGGIAIAQRPESARYDGMPRAAIATELVDLVLAPAEIAAALVEIARHPYVRAVPPAPPEPADEVDQTAARTALFERVFTLLRASTGVDFKQYKRPTIERRVQRRMALHKLMTLEQYVRHLEENPAEVEALFHDLLILVTRFFRDPEAFDALRTIVFPRLLEHRSDDEPIRIWVAGCSTGEEAYSAAMLLVEFLGDRAATVPIQVFATDVSAHAVEQARAGFFPASITADVSAARLRRFFTKADGGYRIGKSVRDLCVFARQDLTRDPPFSKLDLIVCRNVLIYMGAPLQQKLMTIFHYALKPHGFMMLGSAETVGQHVDYFRIEDKKNRIYAKKPVRLHVPPVVEAARYTLAAPVRQPARSASERDDMRAVQHQADRVIQERYAPPGVVVDGDLQIVQFRGHTGPFLEPAPGDPSLNLLKMAREGLLSGLRTAIQSARKSNSAVRKDGLRVRRHDRWHPVSIDAIPLPATSRPHMLVLFREDSPQQDRQQETVHAGRGRAGRSARGRDDVRIAQLEQELESSRDYLQSIIQELEAANEELQSANEEVLSANEELQSTNEELDTAKEELQSTNEELNTVNDELRFRNEELSRANSDLLNLLGSVQIAIVIVSRDLRIRRFTPMAERVLNLIPADVGRPIGHIKPNIDCPDLEAIVTEVVGSVTPAEREVRDSQGNWFALRVRPYKDLENRIEGAVLALFDIQAAKLHALEVQAARTTLDAVLQTVPQPLAVLDPELILRSANDAFVKAFARDGADLVGRPLFDPAIPLASDERLRRLLVDELPRTGGPVRCELAPTAAARTGLVAIASRVRTPSGIETAIVLSFTRPDSGVA